MNTLAQAQTTWHLQGEGELRFLGLLIYRAKLWLLHPWRDEAHSPQALCLELQYARKLEGALIAERSLVEMRRFDKITDAQASRWLARMRSAFPDIAAGDKLTGLLTPAGDLMFFHNGQATLSAPLTDPDFIRLFFGVWLHPNTSAPGLRQQLLGQPAKTKGPGT